jgi:hypothetical protein
MAAPASSAPKPATPRNDEDVRKALQAAYERTARALQNRDVDAYLAEKTATFTARNEGGEVRSRAQVEAQFRQAFARRPGKIREHTFTLLVLKQIDANRVVATVRQQQLAGSHAFTFVSRDTWVRMPGGWKNSEIVTLQGRAMINGKPFRLTPRGLEPDLTVGQRSRSSSTRKDG